MSRCAVWELWAPSFAFTGMELPGHRRIPSLRDIVPHALLLGPQGLCRAG